MITEVGAKNFKGLGFTQALEEKTIFIGPNGSGKTARIQALILAAIGYIPGGSSKTNAEILNTYSDADKFLVSFRLDKTDFARQFTRNLKNGSVSQDFAANGRKVSKDSYLQAMAKAGIPTILDLPEFIAMSDQKKINRIFDLFPPNDDLSKLDEKIQSLDDKISLLQDKIRNKEGLISELTESKTAMELPPGTLAELQDHIETTKNQYRDAVKNLEKVRIEKAEKAATEKAEKEAEEKAENEKAGIMKEAAEKANAEFEARLKTQQEPRQEPRQKTGIGAGMSLMPASGGKRPLSPEARAAEDRLKTRAKKLGLGEFKKPEVPNCFIPKEKTIASIQLIIDTMNKVGCQACTAAMVAKRELAQYK